MNYRYNNSYKDWSLSYLLLPSIISYLQLIPTSTIELCFKLSQMVWHFFKFLFDSYCATSLLWLFKKANQDQK